MFLGRNRERERERKRERERQKERERETVVACICVFAPHGIPATAAPWQAFAGSDWITL